MEGVLEDAYDRLIQESPQGSIYCRRWWLDAVAAGRYRVLTAERRGQLRAAWPIVLDDAGGIGMPPMTQKLGVILAPQNVKYAERLSKEHELIEELIGRLPDHGGVTHRCHETLTNCLPFYWHGFRVNVRYTYLLPDLSDLDALWEGMRSNTRNHIRRAERSGLTVDWNMSPDEFFALNDRTFDRQEMENPLTREVLWRVDEACANRHARQIVAIRDTGGRVHAAVYIVWDSGTAYYLLTGSDPELRRSGAVKLAVWESIRFASTVARSYDFEGSMIRPIEDSFRGFGAVQTPYFAIDRETAKPLSGIAKETGRELHRWVRTRARGIKGVVVNPMRPGK